MYITNYHKVHTPTSPPPKSEYRLFQALKCSIHSDPLQERTLEGVELAAVSSCHTYAIYHSVHARTTPSLGCSQPMTTQGPNPRAGHSCTIQDSSHGQSLLWGPPTGLAKIF